MVDQQKPWTAAAAEVARVSAQVQALADEMDARVLLPRSEHHNLKLVTNAFRTLHARLQELQRNLEGGYRG